MRLQWRRVGRWACRVPTSPVAGRPDRSSPGRVSRVRCGRMRTDVRRELQLAEDMAKKDGVIEIEGHVVEALPNAMFRVELSNGHRVLAAVWGERRQHYVRLLAEDRVVVELSPDGLTRGRIVYRYK